MAQNGSWNWETILYDIICLYSNTVTKFGGKAIEFSEKSAKYGLLCRSRSFKVIDFGINRKPVFDFLLVLSRTVSELLQLIVQILDTLRF